MLARYASAVSTGSLVTLAILFAMQGLIRLQPGAAIDTPATHFVDWIRVPPREDPPRTREPRIDKDILTETNLPPTERPAFSGDGIGVVLANHPDPGPQHTNLDGIATPDGPLISIVRVQPVYPAVAEQRGLEGWVDVRFDVLPTGLATNILVVASSNRVFEKAAVDAAGRFRFKAPVIDGVPQTAHSIEYRFRFSLYD